MALWRPGARPAVPDVDTAPLLHLAAAEPGELSEAVRRDGWLTIEGRQARASVA
jgi:hypothetical protein